MRVNDIFYSLQGEGFFTGTPAVFLRFSGCNLKCSFCDTDHLSNTVMTEEEVVDAVCRYDAKHVVITGGEPSLQITSSLIDKLHDRGRFVQIETNGTVVIPDDCHIDWITCSPKSGGKVVLSHIDELKVVYLDSEEQDMSQYAALKAKEYRLQPLDTHDAERNKVIVKNTIDYILQHPVWKLSLQTHKVVGIE